MIFHIICYGCGYEGDVNNEVFPFEPNTFSICPECHSQNGKVQEVIFLDGVDPCTRTLMSLADLFPDDPLYQPYKRKDRTMKGKWLPIEALMSGELIDAATFIEDMAEDGGSDYRQTWLGRATKLRAAAQELAAKEKVTVNPYRVLELVDTTRARLEATLNNAAYWGWDVISVQTFNVVETSPWLSDYVKTVIVLKRDA